MEVFILISIALTIVLLVLIVAHWEHRRAEFIRKFRFPEGLFAKLQRTRPELSRKDCELVAQGLRQFFLAFLKGGRRSVSMPSQVADDLWHEFILHTKAYDQFCKQSFGRFLHHTPAVALGADPGANEGLRRCFWQACKAENINPKSPSRLPLLFALDEKLRISNGFRYQANGEALRIAGTTGTGGAVYYGDDFSSTRFDGTTDGFGDGGGNSGGGDGGGCGGD